MAKVMFLHMSVILFTRGSLGRETPQTGRTPWQGGTPPDQADPPNQGEPPGPGRTPPQQGGTPLPEPGRPPTCPPPSDQADTPPDRRTSPDQADTPPTRQSPREADSRIWSMSVRYASYWNAFLFALIQFWHRSRMIYFRETRLSKSFWLSDRLVFGSPATRTLECKF